MKKYLIAISLVYCISCSSNKSLIQLPSGMAPSNADEIYQADLQSSKSKRLEQNIAKISWENKGVVIIGVGGTSEEFLNIYPENSSVVLTMERANSFIVKTSRKLSALKKDIRLFKLERNYQKRRLNYASRSLAFMNKSYENKAKKQLYELDISSVNQDVYLIKPQTMLPRGSYFFVLYSKDLDYCIKNFAPKSTFAVSAFDVR